MVDILRKIIPVLSLVIIVQACGSGGGSGSGSQDSALPRRTISWDRPTKYVDNTDIPSAGMVSEYRIYIKTENTVFSELDPYYRLFPSEWNTNPSDPSYKFDLNTTGIVSSFNLQRGKTYFLRMRVVVSDVLSEFSDNTISFNFDNNVSVIY